MRLGYNGAPRAVFGGGRLELLSRLEVEDEVENVVLCPVINVPLTGGSSLPYIGSWLGFWGYKKITRLPL